MSKYIRFFKRVKTVLQNDSINENKGKKFYRKKMHINTVVQINAYESTGYERQ